MGRLIGCLLLGACTQAATLDDESETTERAVATAATDERAANERAANAPVASAGAAQETREDATDRVAGPPPTTESPSEDPTTESPGEDSAPRTPTPGSVRLVVVHDGPLLGSEQRNLAAIRRRLQRQRQLTVEEPSADEDAAIDGYFDGSSARLPARWAQDETVVLLALAAPRTLRGGRRMSRGLRGVAVLRPSEDVALFQARIDPRSAWPLRPEVGDWLDELLDASGGAR